LAEKIIAYFAAEGLKDRVVAVWGLSFKPNTDDMREAPSLEVIRMLTQEGARIQAFDPVAIPNARKVLGENPLVTYFDKAYECLKGADCLALITEWNLFRRPDFERMRSLMRRPVIFDGRNQYSPADLRALGFDYYCIGRAFKPGLVELKKAVSA